MSFPLTDIFWNSDFEGLLITFNGLTSPSNIETLMSIRLLFHFNLLNCQVDKPSKIDKATIKATKGTALVWKIYSLLLNLFIIIFLLIRCAKIVFLLKVHISIGFYCFCINKSCIFISFAI